MKKQLMAILMAAAFVCSASVCESADVYASETAAHTKSVHDVTNKVTGQGTDSQETVDEEVDMSGAVLQEEEVVLVDNDICTIKVTGYEEEDDWGEFGVKVYLENKTDKELMFSVDSAYVNGIDCDPFWAESVNAGKKANDEISFDLEEVGIDYATMIDLYIYAYDAESYDDVMDKSCYTIYPYGEDCAMDYTLDLEDAYQVLEDNDDLTIAVVSIVPENDWDEYSLVMYFVNKTDSELTFDMDSSSINGYMIDSFCYASVQGQKRCFDEADWDWEDLSDNDIETVEEIEMVFEVRDEDYNTVYSNTFTVNP